MWSLDGKVAVITGGTSGIGARTAALFVAQGAKVVIAGRRADRGRSLAATLGDAASFLRTDVTVEADVRALISPGPIATGIFGKATGVGSNEADERIDLAEAAIAAVVPRWQSLSRVGSAEDVANAALFLACDASRFITGHNLVVDGGILAGWPAVVARQDIALFRSALCAGAQPAALTSAEPRHHRRGCRQSRRPHTRGVDAAVLTVELPMEWVTVRAQRSRGRLSDPEREESRTGAPGQSRSHPATLPPDPGM